MAASRCAVALLVLSIEPPRRCIVISLRGILIASATWALAAIFTVGLQCAPTRYALGPTSTDICIDQHSAQVAIRSIDIATDVLLSLLPAIMMMYVQTSLKRKLTVSALFGARILSVRPVALHCTFTYLLRTPIFTVVSICPVPPFFAHSTADRPFFAIDLAIWTAMAVNVSLLTACLPSVKRVLEGLAAGFSNANILEPFGFEQSSNRAASRTGAESLAQVQTYAGARTERVKRRTSNGTEFAHHLRERTHSSEGGEDGESRRGLTEGIVQTVD